MKRLALTGMVLALAITGCVNKRHDADAENIDGAAQADTANIDTTGSAESLPTIDQAEPSNAGAGVRSNDTNVSPAEGAAPANSEPAKPADAPAESAAPVASGTGQMADYSVQKGDTLMKIAFNLYGDISQWKNIYEWNKDKLGNANQLKSGMSLKYDKPAAEPTIEHNGEPYLIKKNDTLGTIADDVYAKKSKWKKIYENNRSLIKDPNKIYAGFYLYYQITEEEKKEAEAIKAKRGGQQLSEAPNLPDSASNGPAKDGGLSGLAGAGGAGAEVNAGAGAGAASAGDARVPASK